ncbi:MerR family transcriptional regulator [Mycolicibacterium sp. GF69]|uniref:MerR family transcriptional regulator n=1 Tax=Mycolicibacterium sp. GF69 TaxID=2267251 RepID=UPI000DCBF5F1|nr:MerR family transcriptional regulator [Mycolicibacterium sp. GF69]RAV07144.1 MerR family transcriptional regulator [Mycolicibacterium sp. GF69]
MTEYRLDELAQISGVSARNIRAYRERGLLDPPRRVGRSALYDDYHLSQLRTINQLHRRGFNSAHIAEFFASLRQGADLADILGIQRAVLEPRTGPGDGVAATEVDATAERLDIGADSDEAGRLIEFGLADLVDDVVVLTDPTVRQVMARSSDQLADVRALLRIFESTREAIDALAAGFAAGLDECVAARSGADGGPPQNVDELARVVGDYRGLWARVVSDRLDKALHQHMAAAVARYSGREE